MKSEIGLDVKMSKKVAASLNVLLANYQLYYQNLRGLHWNIKGTKFFELHLKFEELYTDAQIKIDEIAERILTLGRTPLHSFSEYLEASEIKEHKNISKGREGVEVVLSGLKTIIISEREALKSAVELEDEGTITMLTDFISMQEKIVWMLSSWLKKHE